MEENFDDWRKAGKIAAESLAYGKGLIKEGASYLEITEKIEAKIKELGGECAFPPQMSLNEVAAHFTVDPEEDIILKDELVNLDIGVHVNGAIGDNAVTVDLSGQNTELVKASEEALKEAIKKVQLGVRLGEIGKVIQETIESFGFKPIRNLSGHGLGRYDIHTEPQIPNIDVEDDDVLEEGFIAIEPFATDGAGLIYDTEKGNIFSVVTKKPVRSPVTRQVLKEISRYQGLPFTTRWLVKKFPLFKVNFALKDLLNVGVIKSYPPLPDKGKGLVSQAEKSLYVWDKVEILTKVD